MNHRQRAHAQRVQAYLVWKKDRVGYLERRPMVTAHIKTMAELERLVAEGFDMDCSESVTLVCHIIGAHDPNGNDYNGYGDTETMLNHLPHYSDAKGAEPGALVVFNSDQPLSEQHVAQVHEHDPTHGNPVLFTHGTAADPSFHTLEWMQHGFAGRTTFLSVAKL